MDELNAEVGGAHPRKRAHKDCFVHCSNEGPDSKLIKPQDLNSWLTLLKAAEIRKHAPVLELVKDLPNGAIPEVYYHRKCRSIFTMKKLLDSMRQKDEQTTVDDRPVSSRQSSRCTPSPSRVYEAKCIFCQKVTKYKPHEKNQGATNAM